MEGLKIKKTKECHFTPKFFVQGMVRRDCDTKSTFALHGSKSAQFLSPPEFLLSPPLEVGLTKNLEHPWAKILTANQFQL
jgi:hypothetical protein